MPAELRTCTHCGLEMFFRYCPNCGEPTHIIIEPKEIE